MEKEIDYYVDGNKHLERYYKNNKRHRLDGPASIRYYKNGNKHYEEYWINGYIHRLDGPAIIYYENGNISYEGYWVNGNVISPNDIDEILKECNGNKQMLIDILTIRYS